ncbi:MAG: Crp/Fnr family transcriptional regulator [Acetobacteraceae bacterium]|nr:Crp/Fnr family transcriptional regulator [Acetobacteraceae bacterium]
MPLRRELGTVFDLEAGARVVPAGSDVYRQGDICPAYYIVLNGWIALTVLLDDGSCQILDFALPGAVLGFQSGPGTPMYHSARSLSVVRVYALPRRKLDAIIEQNPRLAVLLCRQITADEARAHDHLTNLGLRGARERIARLLLEVYVRLRRRLPAEPGEIIHLPLSQSHIGQALGLTYVHVCRTLQIFARAKGYSLCQPQARNHRSLGPGDSRRHRGRRPRLSTPSSISRTVPGELSGTPGCHPLFTWRVDARRKQHSR